MRLYRLTAILLCIVLSAFACLGVFADDSVDTDVTSSDSSEESSSGGGDYSVSYGYKPLQSYDGTQASDYIHGTTPPTDYVSAGGSHTVAANGYTFRDYVFAGWSDGYKVYQPGDIIYNINSDIVLTATWCRPERPDMTVHGILSYFNGDEPVSSESVEIGSAVTLASGTWQDGDGRIFTGGSRFLMSFNTVDFKSCDSGKDTVTVSYNGNGTSDGVQCAFKIAAGGSFKVDACYGVRDGYSFICWEDAAGKVYLPGDTCKADTNTVLTAKWQEADKPAPDYCTVTINVGKGGSSDPFGKVTVERGEKLTVNVTADDGYKTTSFVFAGESLGIQDSYTVKITADSVIDIAFESVGGTSAGDSSATEHESTPAAESKPDAAHSSESRPSDSASKSNGDEDTDGSLARKGMAIIIIVCIICIGVCIPYMVKASNGKGKRGKKSRR